MDQMSNDGLVNANLFGDGQHLAFDDTMFSADQSFNVDDASWGVNASAYQQPGSRAVSTHPPSWQQPASHVSASNTPVSYGQSSIYQRPPLHSPASFVQDNAYGGFSNPNFNNFNPHQQQQYAHHLPQQNIDPTFQQPQHYNATLVNTAQDPHQSRTPTEQNQVPTPKQTPQASFPVQQQQQQQPPNAAAQSQPTKGQNELMQEIPASEQNGRFNIIDLPGLVKATNSERLAMFATIGRQPHEFPVNRSTALPTYTKRYSRSELKRKVKDDPKLQAKLNSKISLSDRSVTASTKATSASSPQSNDGIKYESDSDSGSDSDVSLYSDESGDDMAGAPLPNKKPEDSASGAVEYDTIKALWRNKRKSVDASSIRKGLGDFWEVVKTIRDRWKADTQAVQDAEAKKRVGDLALLKGRVKDQRDLLEVAFRATLKHGLRGIIELFSENTSFLYLCYQFLLDRFKAGDLNGQVSRLILEILSMTTSITDEKLDKTFLGKILPRYQKAGDGKTKFYAKKILEGAAANSKGKQAKPSVEPTTGVKRSSTTAGNAATTAPAKKPAVSAATPGTGAAAKPAVKKAADLSKPSTTAASIAPPKTKTVQAKSSGFFAGLQTVGKKPGTSNSDKTAAKPAVQRTAAAAPAKPAFNLAAELANLAKPKEEPKKPEPKPDTTQDNESPERKAKRARRLARGAAGVRWKEADDLVEIRYFSHDPAEELDHDASQMRDVKDVGGEGRMLKQHADMMDVDDEDDSAEEDSTKFIAFKTPSEVDFSTVDQEDRDRQYAPYGGGKLNPDSPERTIREQYERDNLIVIYSSPSDIPPNPREPDDPFNGETGGPLQQFGSPPEKFVTRAHQHNAKKIAHMPTPKNAGPSPPAPALAPGFDIAAFAQYMASQQAPLPPQQQQAPAQPPVQQSQQPAAPFDLNAILKQFQPASTPPPAQQQPMYNYQHANYAQQQQPAPSRPSGEPDISAILAALNPNNAAQAAPATGPPAFQFPSNFVMPFGGPADQNQQHRNQQQQTGGGGHGGVDKKRDNPWYKTKACKYWQEGKCKKGDDCGYLHE